MEKNFAIKSKQISCTLEGDPNNPPIIMIHDFGSHRGVWRQTIAALSQKYYCVAVDLLGFGASDKPDGSDYSLSAQSQRILMLADQLGFKRFSLLGHSMGGQIACYIASVLAPSRIEKLVTVNGIMTGRLSGQVEKVTVPAVSQARKWPWLYKLGTSFINFRPYANYAFKSWFYDFKNYPFKLWEVDRLAAYNPACAISADESLKAIRALDLTPQLRKVKAKALIIAGKQDGMVPLDQALLAQTLIPSNDLALIEKCGHFPMYEKTSNYLKALALIF
jgi:pimeloyl-ACP methyl ester carboxylesterase